MFAVHRVVIMIANALNTFDKIQFMICDKTIFGIVAKSNTVWKSETIPLDIDTVQGCLANSLLAQSSEHDHLHEYSVGYYAQMIWHCFAKHTFPWKKL